MRKNLARRPGRRLFSLLLPGPILLPSFAAAHAGDAGRAVVAAGPPRPEALVLPAILFGIFLAGSLVAFFLLRDSEYVRRVRGFRPNAKLLLLRGPFLGLSIGIWNLLFNLYLLALGFEPAFVAKMIAVSWLLHGLLVIPAGMLSDLFGRRVTYLCSYSTNIACKVMLLITLDPTWLLALSALSGGAEGFHAIVGPPFLTEQSEPEERIYLFSVDSVIKTGSNFAGNLGAGVLPLAVALTVGVAPGGAWGFRGALFLGLPIMVTALVPIYLIREDWQRLSLRKWWGGVRSYRHIAMLAVTSALMSVGLGATAPFFNVYFATKLHAATEDIGLIFSLAALAVAGATLFTPLLVQRLGKVNTIVWVRMAGVPFVLLLGLTDSILWAAVFYLISLILIGGLFPTMGMVDPVYQLFPMELVEPAERGTTNGVIHAFKEFPMAIGAAVAGFYIAQNQWFPSFWIASVCYAISFLIYFAYFRQYDAAAGDLGPPPPSAQAESD